MKYMLVAGEASGDLHGSRLIAAIKKVDPSAEFVFFGGDLMAAEASSSPVVHYKDMAFMGFSEVLRNIKTIFGNLHKAKDILKAERPDALIPVDYPGFNLKLAKAAHKAGIPVYWFISPKLWAWKSWRVRKIRKYVRKMLCIFPFEPQWYAAHGFDRGVFVGNPTVEEIVRAVETAPSRSEFFEEQRLRDRDLLVLMPGSRRGEIKCNLPVMDAVAREFPQYTIVVSGAPGIPDEFYESLTKFKVVKNRSHTLLAHAHAALVTSGTATLEAAVAGVPQVVLYRSNGSKLAYNIMKSILKVKYVSLPNIVVDRAIVSEQLLHDCTPEQVSARLREITPSTGKRIEMLRDYAEVFDRLTVDKNSAAEKSAEIIVNDLKKLKKIQ